MKKNIVALISFIIMIVLMIVIVVLFKQDTINIDDSKLEIVATLFPQYDIAKQIVGDKANVTLLIGSGVETHNYEPTSKDMIRLLDYTDMFLYTGENLEPWTTNIIYNLKENDVNVVNVARDIELIKTEEFEEKNINSEIINDEESEHAHSHEEIYDGHVWLAPENAVKMLDTILAEVIKQDPENEAYYRSNADLYRAKILNIDARIKDIVANSARKEIAVGGEFAYAYLVSAYDLKFVSVYNNCGEGEDPSIAKVKSIIDYINKHDLPVVYYEELSEGTVAKMIASETKAKSLVLYSIHNGVPGEDTYVSLMEKNIESLKEGLN